MKTDRFLGSDGLVHVVSSEAIHGHSFVVTACIATAWFVIPAGYEECAYMFRIVTGTLDQETCLLCIGYVPVHGRVIARFP